MRYDPIKDRLATLAERSPALHRALFHALDTVLLRAWYVHRALRAILAQPSAGPIHVLDAGCGFGQYAYWLLRQDPRVRVTAVDLKETYLTRAQRFFEQVGLGDRISFRRHDLTEPLAEEGVFDVALSVDVLEHIEDDRAALESMARALRPGGYLVLSTPSDLGGSDALATGASFIDEHVREGYSIAELAGKLDAVGLRVTDWTYTYGHFGSLGWRLLVKQPIRLLSRSWLLAPALLPYYLICGPLGIALNAMDVRSAKPTGTGLLVTARRDGQDHQQ